MVNSKWLVAGGAGLLIMLGGAPLAAADPSDAAVDPASTAAVPADPTAAVPADPTAAPATLADGVPHLPSPDNLPPGTTQEAQQQPAGSYLRDVWHALRNHDVSMSDALLLIAQRPMSATPTGMTPHDEQLGQVDPPPAAEQPPVPTPDTTP